MTAESRTGALVLASLYLDPTPEREQDLREAAQALGDWDAALTALEAHGILGLAQRNLERAGIELPLPVADRLDGRAEVMRAIDGAYRLTLERFLEEAGRRGIEVTLLKGASLALDLYPEGGLRTQGDLDLLVAKEDLSAGVEAARLIGFERPEGAFPVWWYRLAHFHLKLFSLDSFRREIELHWHLHPPTRLHTLRLEDLRARRRPCALGPGRAWTLDPLDRLLHLVTHLRRHAPPEALGRATLLAWAADPRAPLRMKWLVDVRAEIERRHEGLVPSELARRAQEWNAEADLSKVLDWMKEQLGFAGAAEEWVERVLALLPREPKSRLEPAQERQRPLPGLDLRPAALGGLPRWIWPSAATFRRAGNGGSLPRRMGHAGGVLLRLGLLGSLLPVAWLARALSTRRPSATAERPDPARTPEPTP